ncbi:hypothetical protein WN51_00615 [Melipona quadrifasciata]|uniref:Uncharacterized protein n=1 Tax=Melipona quadrifasciata TaxID=166423 RepID=A0A0N0U551_9HYME|nr:hypothetical protein WN51_00615 [Melipona quadrifasciata]
MALTKQGDRERERERKSVKERRPHAERETERESGAYDRYVSTFYLFAKACRDLLTYDVSVP